MSAAEILGLEQLIDRLPRELSGGQRQRVAMGRAIVRNPRAFLFDEPLSNLDAKLRVKMRGEIKRLHQRLGKTTIYVTHDQTEAMTMADKIVVLNGGKIEQAGAPLELYNNPVNLFVASFIGSPEINLFEATYAGGTDVALKNGDKAAAWDGARCSGWNSDRLRRAAATYHAGRRPVFRPPSSWSSRPATRRKCWRALATRIFPSWCATMRCCRQTRTSTSISIRQGC